MHSRFVSYSMAIKSAAFIPSIVCFVVFFTLILVYGRIKPERSSSSNSIHPPGATAATHFSSTHDDDKVDDPFLHSRRKKHSSTPDDVNNDKGNDNVDDQHSPPRVQTPSCSNSVDKNIKLLSEEKDK